VVTLCIVWKMLCETMLSCSVFSQLCSLFLDSICLRIPLCISELKVLSFQGVHVPFCRFQWLIRKSCNMLLLSMHLRRPRMMPKPPANFASSEIESSLWKDVMLASFFSISTVNEYALSAHISFARSLHMFWILNAHLLLANVLYTRT